jgi:hypothetical protein
MKKLNMTAVEYQHHMRQSQRARTQKFKADMAAKGYKTFTVYLSQDNRDLIDDICKDKGLNKLDAIEFIFDVYRSKIDNNVINNSIKPEPNKDQILENKEDIENKGLKQPESQPNNQQDLLLFEDEEPEEIKQDPQEQLSELKTDDEEETKEEKEKRKEEYTKLILDMRDKGLKAKDIKTKLEKMGVKTSGNKSKWSLSTIYHILKTN